MKARLNLTIEEHLLTGIKAYAAEKGMSVSELAEDYFKRVTMGARRKKTISLIEELPSPSIDPGANLKEQYYKDTAKK